MRQDSRLSVALHVLLHMGELGRSVTSEQLGPLLKTNPVVLRRTLSGLREAGIVRSEKGHGGGWSLGRELSSVTLQDVYDALGTVTPFGIGHRQARPRCPLEQAVNHVVTGALDEAEAVLMKRLRSVSVASLVKTALARRMAS
ncbi:MAG TPA: Rrf2 family transcriptional regulator [Polyangiaceae bacterium]|nr:Rrf2 family transcriptional regulator [Polyangiaceae bacterium]